MLKNIALILLCLSIGNVGFSAGGKNNKAVASAKEKAAKQESSTSELKLSLVKMNGADGKDMVEIASSSKDHSTLVAAVKATGLVETLTGPGPYTLFAPTNEAFDKLPKGTVETLLKPENKAKLKSILEHHAAAPSYTPDVLKELSEVDVVDGPKLAITYKDGKIFVEGNEVKAAIAAKNGTIYIIDTVLLAK